MSYLAIAEGILFRACATTGFYPKVLRGKTRITMVAQTRQAIAFAIKKRTDMSLSRTANFIGLTDHSTIKHAMKIVPERMASNPEYGDFVESLLSADPVKPLTTESLLKEFGVEPIKPKYDAGKQWAITRNVPEIAVKAEHRPEVVQRPPVEPRPAPVARPRTAKKPTRPTYDFIDCDAGHEFMVDENGRDRFENNLEADIIAGSRGLALSILTARAQA